MAVCLCTAWMASVSAALVRASCQLGRPMDVEFETSGDILIVDRRNNKIGVFSEEGVLLREFVGPPLFDSPTALAMRNGRLYVLNSRNVQILE